MCAVYRQSRERTSHALAGAAILCLSLTLAGCMGGPSGVPLGSLVADEDVTGSIPAPQPASLASPLPLLGGDDWALASKALASALDPQGTGAPVAWENAVSGMRGTITPVGFLYAADGQTCRAFIAEIAGRAPPQRWQGRGCRAGRDDWAVSDLKPFGA